jgi:hypothetical protein
MALSNSYIAHAEYKDTLSYTFTELGPDQFYAVEPRHGK